jgi:hypothetical protein
MKIKSFFLLALFLILCACSSDNDPVTTEENTLKSINYEVLLFEFTADTGNNSSRLKYNIKYTNPNNVAVKGSTAVTLNYDGIILKPIKRVPPYIEIETNSSYTESYDVESAFNINEGKVNSIKFVSAEFVIATD